MKAWSIDREFKGKLTQRAGKPRQICPGRHTRRYRSLLFDKTPERRLFQCRDAQGCFVDGTLCADNLVASRKRTLRCSFHLLWEHALGRLQM